MPEDEALKRLIEKHKPKLRQRAEANLSTKLQTLAGKLRARLWRNTVGTLQDRHGRYVTYGLGVGSPDLVGYQVRVITPEMVGQKVAVFLAIEVKKPGRDTTEKHHRTRQEAWIADVVFDGGIGQIVRSEQELELLLTNQTTRVSR